MDTLWQIHRAISRIETRSMVVEVTSSNNSDVDNDDNHGSSDFSCTPVVVDECSHPRALRTCLTSGAESSEQLAAVVATNWGTIQPTDGPAQNDGCLGEQNMRIYVSYFTQMGLVWDFRVRELSVRSAAKEPTSQNMRSDLNSTAAIAWHSARTAWLHVVTL